jgi:hypothetical protein
MILNKFINLSTEKGGLYYYCFYIRTIIKKQFLLFYPVSDLNLLNPASAKMALFI